MTPAASTTPARAPRIHSSDLHGVTVGSAWLSAVEGDRGHRAAALAVGERDVAAPAAHQLARDREAEAGAGRPGAAGLPRWKRSNTASSSPGSTPGPSSSTSIAPGRATSVTRAVAVVRARSRSARRARGRGRRGRRGRARVGRAATSALDAAVEARGGARGRRRRGRPPRRARRPRPPGRAAAARRPSRTGGRPRSSAASISLGVAGGARLLEPQPQAGERRAQLVRGVGDELALAVDEPLEPRASSR